MEDATTIHQNVTFLKISFTPFQEETLLDSAVTEGAVLGLRGKKKRWDRANRTYTCGHYQLGTHILKNRRDMRYKRENIL